MDELLQKLKDGNDLCFFSYGQTLHPCLDAANELEKIISKNEAKKVYDLLEPHFEEE